MKGKLPVKPWDTVIIIIALAMIGFFAYSIYVQPRDTIQVLIEGSGRRWVFPLNADETIKVPGPLGNTIVRIHGHHAWVESSPCDNQICVAAGRLSGRGTFAACLPNFVLVIIEGYDELRKLDGTAR